MERGDALNSSLTTKLMVCHILHLKLIGFFFIHFNTSTIENIFVWFQAHHVKISLA